MGIEEAEELLRNCLNGLATEVFWADQTCALAEEVGRHAEQVNTASFGELFGSFQLVLVERQALAAVKIFDPVKQYPTRSIPGTLILSDSKAELWRVHERRRLHRVLIEAGLDNSRVDDMSNAELNRAVDARFRNTLPDSKRVSPDNLSLSLNILQ